MNNKAVGGTIAFFAVTVLALCITTIVLIADKLYRGGVWDIYDETTGDYLGTVSASKCLMTNNSINICRYGYSVGGIGALSCVVLCVAMCAPAVMSILLSIFNTIWFLGWAITAQVYSDNIEGMSMIDAPWQNVDKDSRHDVIIMAWTCFAVSFVSLLLSFMMKKKEKEVDGDLPMADKPDKGDVEAQAKMTPEAQAAGYPPVHTV